MNPRAFEQDLVADAWRLFAGEVRSVRKTNTAIELVPVSIGLVGSYPATQLEVLFAANVEGLALRRYRWPIWDPGAESVLLGIEGVLSFLLTHVEEYVDTHSMRPRSPGELAGTIDI